MNPAERVPLGRTGLEVTRLGLGTAPLGGMYEAVSDEEGRAVVDAAWTAGLRFFDTAPLYGSGQAERRLGGYLRQRPRDEFALATKVGRLLRADAPSLPSYRNPYRVGWEAFLRHVAAGAPLACDFTAGIRDVAFAEACHRSMEERRWVAFPPPAPAY